MRARNIKPGFFKNEYLAECSPLSRVLFAGLWCMADREGRLEYRPKRIKAEVLPYDNASIEKMIGELQQKNFLQVYGMNGDKYINIINFRKHQNPHVREQESVCPAPDKHSAEHNLGDAEHRSSPADSPILIPDSPIRRKGVFENFWKAYPKKKSRGQAEKAWLKINPDEQLLATMIATIERAKKSEDWQKDQGKYIPHPATWLNAKGWEDEETETHPLSGKVSDRTIKTVEMLKEWRPPQ